MRLLRQAWLLTRSELRQELRDLELLLTAGFFSLLMLAMFGLSFTTLPRAESHLIAVPGLLWMSIAFVGSLTLTRAFDREREADTLRALLVAPVDRIAIYLAKAALTLTVLLLSCAVLVPGLMLLFPVAREFAARPFESAALVVLGCLGYVAVGTLFAAGLSTSSGKNVLVSIILFPLTTPVLIYNLVATRTLLDGHPAFATYLGKMLALDVVLVAVAALMFESVLVGSKTQQPTRRRR